MNGLKVMLFGLAVICSSGFFLVGQGLGVISESFLTWGLVFGVLLCFLGLLAGERRGRADGEHARVWRPDAGDDGDDSDVDGESDGDDDREYYLESRFPPM